MTSTVAEPVNAKLPASLGAQSPKPALKSRNAAKPTTTAETVRLSSPDSAGAPVLTLALSSQPNARITMTTAESASALIQDSLGVLPAPPALKFRLAASLTTTVAVADCWSRALLGARLPAPALKFPPNALQTTTTAVTVFAQLDSLGAAPRKAVSKFLNVAILTTTVETAQVSRSATHGAPQLTSARLSLPNVRTITIIAVSAFVRPASPGALIERPASRFPSAVPVTTTAESALL